MLLQTEPIVFGGNTLEIGENTRAKGNASTSSGALFKPRNLGPSRPKAGLGFKKASFKERSSEVASASSGGKGQDDFRKMLERK